MTQGILYTVTDQGDLQRMMPSAPASEDHMQALVAQYPELITDGDGDLLLIRREHPVGDSDESSGRWSLDHLFVTREAIPVLVELKRAVDTRLRREVVGQILDYAANATAYWKAGKIASAFAETVIAEGKETPEQKLTTFIGTSDERETAAFWTRIDDNFKAGRIKLVFVADAIPSELAIIVEFLNEQMRADVRAVELKWFADQRGSITLSPRIIGETERARSIKAPISQAPIDREDWIEKNMSPLGSELVRSTQTFVQIIEECDGRIEAKQGSLNAQFIGRDGKIFLPFSIGSYGQGQVSLNFKSLYGHAAFASEDTRRMIYDHANATFGPLSTQNLAGWPAFKALQLNDSEKVNAFKGLVEMVKSIGNKK